MFGAGAMIEGTAAGAMSAAGPRCASGTGAATVGATAIGSGTAPAGTGSGTAPGGTGMGAPRSMGSTKAGCTNGVGTGRAARLAPTGANPTPGLNAAPKLGVAVGKQGCSMQLGPLKGRGGATAMGRV